VNLDTVTDIFNQYPLKTLQKHLPSSGWFIAGGYALDNHLNTSYSDIDVYITDESLYTDIILSIFPHGHQGPVAYTQWDFQFIPVFNQSIDTVLGNFDLLCCRLAILPNNSLYFHHTFTKEPIPAIINCSTIKRIPKYATRLNLDQAPYYKQYFHSPPDTIYDYYSQSEVPFLDHLKRSCNHLPLQFVHYLPVSIFYSSYFCYKECDCSSLPLEYQSIFYSKANMPPTPDMISHYPEYFL
jgi:hypothetical protein